MATPPINSRPVGVHVSSPGEAETRFDAPIEWIEPSPPSSNVPKPSGFSGILGSIVGRWAAPVAGVLLGVALFTGLPSGGSAQVSEPQRQVAIELAHAPPSFKVGQSKAVF